MWDVLKEYPAARVRLESIAVKRLEKYKKAPLEKGKALVLFAATPLRYPVRQNHNPAQPSLPIQPPNQPHNIQQSHQNPRPNKYHSKFKDTHTNTNTIAPE